MDNNNNYDFEALIAAIKESSKPTVELAKVLQERIKPVKYAKLRDPDISKLNFGEVSYEVHYEGRCINGDTVVLKYSIQNEVSTEQGCVAFTKGMVYNVGDTDYFLTKAIECGDLLFVTFTVSEDKVLID